jgi:hypothetical protein
MATDLLTLGGVTFDDWSTPDKMMFGGRHSAVVHKLPGGARVVDMLGPDEADITFRGTFYGDAAMENAQALDALRASGQVVPLAFGGQYRLVLIQEAVPVIERYPHLVTFTISCLVVQNPMQGVLGAIVSGFGDLAASDMASMMSVSGQ